MRRSSIIIWVKMEPS